MNLFKKTTAAVALVTLVSGIFSTGVSAYSTSEIEAANTLAQAGVIVDQSANPAAYNLDQNVLRQEIAAVARGVAGLSKETVYSNVFSDVTATTPNTWAWASVNALANAGLVAKNPTFRPEANISKAEAVGMVVKAAFGDQYSFDSSKGTTWQEQVVAFAVANGVVSSFTNYDTAATRGFVFDAAANAMSTEDEEIDDVICALLGTCDDSTTDTTDDTTDTTNTGSVVSGGNVEVSLSPSTPSWTIAAESPRTTLMVFDVSAWSVDALLNTVNLKYTGNSDSSKFSELAVYYKGSKITKWDDRKFSTSDLKVELSFNKDIVVKAGSTMTFEVTGKIGNPGWYVTHQITLENITSSANFSWKSISSNTLIPVTIANKTSVVFQANKATEEVLVGKTVKLAGFKLYNEKEIEDAMLKTVTFTVDGTVDTRDVSNLVVLVDGKEINSKLSINTNNEIVAVLDVTIPKSKRIDIALNGSVNGSVGKTIQTKIAADSDIYVVGSTSNVALSVTKGDVANSQPIKGSKINVSFTKGSQDSVKYNTTGVEVGTLKIKADADYEVKSLNVNIVAAGGKTVADAVKAVKVKGSVEDSTSGIAANKNFIFKDISLKANQELLLPITLDINNDVALNGTDLTFTVSFSEIKDDNNRKTYPADGALTTVLSTNSFDSKTVKVQAASFDLSSNTLTDRELVLANGAEVVLYNGKAQIGDSDKVTVTEFTLNQVGNLADLKDVIDTVTLDINGKKINWTVSATKVEFTGVNTEITAGSRNVPVIVTAKLKSFDLPGTKTIRLAYLANAKDSITVEDSEWKTAWVNEAVSAATLPLVTLKDKGAATFKVVNSGKYKDQIKKVVLAGATNVKLAEIEAEAKEEDVVVKKLQFTVALADYTSTFKNLSLVNAADGKAIEASAWVATYNNTDTVIEFKDVKLVAAAKKVNLMLVADLNIVTTEGWVQSAALGNLVVAVSQPAASDVKGASSNKEVSFDIAGTVSSTAVSVVPALVTVAPVKTLGKDLSRAELKFVVDYGTNKMDNTDITVSSIDLEAVVADLENVRNNDNETVTVTALNADPLVITANNKISNNDIWSFNVTENVTSKEIRIKTIKFKVGGAGDYSVSNDKIIDLWKYVD